MKYLLLLILLTGCGSEAADKDELIVDLNAIKIPAYHNYPYQEVVMEGMEIHDMNSPKNAGGLVTRSGDNWRFDSHTNFDCVGVLKGWCRKADVGFTEGSRVINRIVKYSFTLNVIEYNETYPPEWVILFQDWVRIIDGLSNHPMTTLKLNFDNGIKLCSYHNSWQLDWTEPDWGHVSDGSIHDHPEEEQLGCADISKNQYYDVEFYITDSGVRSLVVDGQVIYNHLGRTKHDEKPHIYSFGTYWSLGYNIEFDASKNLSLTIDSFKRHEFQG